MFSTLLRTTSRSRRRPSTTLRRTVRTDWLSISGITKHNGTHERPRWQLEICLNFITTPSGPRQVEARIDEDATINIISISQLSSETATIGQCSPSNRVANAAWIRHLRLHKSPLGLWAGGRWTWECESWPRSRCVTRIFTEKIRRKQFEKDRYSVEGSPAMYP